MSGYQEETRKNTKHTFAREWALHWWILHSYFRTVTSSTSSNRKEQNCASILDVDDFMHLRETEWKARVTSSALHWMQQQRWKAPKILPLAKDCVAFNSFLQRRERETKADVFCNGKLTATTYKVGKVTLAQVVLYNKPSQSLANAMHYGIEFW